MTDVPIHQLRQWEGRFPQLRPRRDRANRRYYLAADIDIVRRIKQLIQHEGLTTAGAIKRLDLELHGVGKPLTRQELIDLVDELEHEVRAVLDLLDPHTEIAPPPPPDGGR
jgi:DNA-binding transcriptional MerR regulator